MKTKRGQQNHETMIKDDFLKVLQRCFELKAKGKETWIEATLPLMNSLN